MSLIIALDFDGTLVDSVESIWLEFQRVIEAMDLPKISYDDFKQQLGKVWDNVLTGLWPGINIQEFNRNYRVEAEKPIPIRGVHTALKKLEDHYPLVILTSRGEDTLIKHLELTGFTTTAFDGIYHRDNLPYHKPDPEALLSVCGDYSVDAEDLLYVGDSLVDFECAMNAGTRFVGVLTGAASGSDFTEKGVADVIDSVTYLPGFLGLE
ncbi:MAG: HAD family hydrolase [Candidatus Altiarchaeota archaeon]